MFSVCPVRFITRIAPRTDTGIPNATQKDIRTPRNSHRITNTNANPLIPLFTSISSRSRISLDISDHISSLIPSGTRSFFCPTYSRTALAISMLSSSAVLNTLISAAG